jgi:hypothetical protein
MSQPASDLPEFNEQYGALVKGAFQEYVTRLRVEGVDLAVRAEADAGRGKPDFVLALVLATELPDPAKRDLLARAFERRAELTLAKAADLEAEHNRPFPLIGLEARKDRAMAKQVRAGKMIRPYARAPKPLGAL